MQIEQVRAVRRRQIRKLPMKMIQRGLVLSMLIVAWPAFANDAPPSDASIQELLTLTQSEELINGMKPQLNAMISSSINEVSRGKQMTPERQAVIDRMREKMVAAFDESINFQSMQMITLRVYQATYTQDEVNGLIAFYKTPAGQALINKKSVMMQNMLAEMQTLMRPVTQRMIQIRSEADQEIKAQSAPK
jgi:hypothetical protein